MERFMALRSAFCVCGGLGRKRGRVCGRGLGGFNTCGIVEWGLSAGERMLECGVLCVFASELRRDLLVGGSGGSVE